MVNGIFLLCCETFNVVGKLCEAVTKRGRFPYNERLGI